jgi:hypothetical protein
MGKEYIPKPDMADARDKERRCLKCGKRVVGRWLCELFWREYN